MLFFRASFQGSGQSRGKQRIESGNYNIQQSAEAGYRGHGLMGTRVIMALS